MTDAWKAVSAARVQAASEQALAFSCGVLVNPDAYVAELRRLLQAHLDAAELEAGEYIVQVQAGTAKLPIVVRVQADLFDATSINIDATSLDA